MFRRTANPSHAKTTSLWSVAAAVVTASLLAVPTVRAQGIGGEVAFEDEATLIDQKLGAYIALDATFRDETGKAVKIRDYFTGERPVILNLQYYRCPSLCGPVLNGLVNALNAIGMTAGEEFEVLSVSFDHRENPAIASDKKKSVLTAFQNKGGENHWHFLTGDRDNIRKLTNSVGYGFRWNETKNDFDHRAAVIFMAPDGTITRYLRGAVYDRKTFRLALVEASDGTVGTALEKFLLSCYGYDPRTGTYSRIGPMVMMTGAGLTIAALAALLFVLIRRERHRVVPAAAS